MLNLNKKINLNKNIKISYINIMLILFKKDLNNFNSTPLSKQYKIKSKLYYV